MTAPPENGRPVSVTRALGDAVVAVLEDEFLIAMDLEDMLGEWGCRQVLVANSVSELRRLLPDGGADLVIADYNLSGETSAGLVGELVAAGTPVVVLTGQTLEPGLLAAMGDPPVVQKPVQPAALRERLERALDGAG